MSLVAGDCTLVGGTESKVVCGLGRRLPIQNIAPDPEGQRVDGWNETKSHNSWA